MSESRLAGFVSRVAERVSTAGEGLAAQLIDWRPTEFDGDGLSALTNAFPYVEPSAEFALLLRQNLMDAPAFVPVGPFRAIVGDRRVVYGVAAFGSLASAAVVAMFLLRYRSASRPAA
ncbi:MAG TPA: hypothetical protein VKT80_16655 [Chloroflexota bacterium]|nr:hypothetical protein [Chloroflexota bacterium]